MSPPRQGAEQEGVMRVRVPFSLSDLAQLERRLGSFSGDPTNYGRECDKIPEIAQGPDENPAAFVSRLSEDVLKLTSLDPGSAEGRLLNIREKLPKLEDLIKAAFREFRNREEEKTLGQKRREKIEKRKRQGKGKARKREHEIPNACHCPPGTNPQGLWEREEPYEGRDSPGPLFQVWKEGTLGEALPKPTACTSTVTEKINNH